MKYNELKAHINEATSGKIDFSPLYIVCGDDDYLKREAVDAFRNIAVAEYADFNVSTFSSDGGVGDAIDALYTFPMFDERKIVILNVGEKLAPTDKDAILSYLAQPSETSVFIAVCDGDTAKTLKHKKSETVDCSRLDDASLVRVISELAAQAPVCKIERDAIDELIERTQGGMARIVGEMAKLKAYVDGVITKKDVCDMVSADLDFQIYELANALSLKDANKALEVLDVFFKNGIRPMTVISMVYDKYRKMLHAELNKGLSNDELGRLLGIKGGAVYYLRQASANYSQVRLKKSVDYLHALQYDVLSGRRLEASALHEATLELLNI